jgi:hypothetical protein
MKRLLPTLIWVAAGLALLVSFWLDLANSAQGGAIDLRNRITGVRLLEKGIDPYHYKWHEGDPAEYCDPFNNPKLEVSRTTATPALLVLHAPLAPLPYRLGQFLWLGLQWLLLLGTGWLWLRACTTPRQRAWVGALVIGFSYTAAWRLHAERGQSYVLLAFVFGWWLTATLDPKKSSGFSAGFLAGFLATLRPPFLLLVPFLAWHRRGQWAGVAVGLLAGIGVPMLWAANCWPDYFSAMQTNAFLNHTHFYPHFTQAYPPRIEGVPTDTLAHYAAIPFAKFSVPALISRLGILTVPDSVVLLGALVPFAAWLWWTRAQAAERLLAGLAAWFFLIDLFLPTYRNSYNDVTILNVVAAGILASDRFPRAAWPCAIGLPVGWAIYVFAPERPSLINLPTLLLTISAVLFLFPVRDGAAKGDAPGKKPKSRAVAAAG